MRREHGAKKTNSDKNVKLQYWAHKIQDGDKQNTTTQHNTENW